MRCIVKDCKNHEHEGQFIGSLCFPCHTYITKGEGKYSQAFRNVQRTWVGLTDEDKEEIKKQANYHWEMTTGEYAQIVQNLTEVKLKQKNEQQTQ